MQTHAIVEIEEGALTVVVGARTSAGARVLRSQRVPLASLEKESVSQALRSLGGDVLQGATGVHVVLGERRMQHFASTVPQLSAGAMVDFVVRESLRLTGLQQADEVMVATRLMRRLPGKRWMLGATAIGRAVWEPIQAALQHNQFRVLGLHSTEACMALAAPARSAAPIAMLECTAGRARFVVCDGQNAVQVRRFVIGGASEQNHDALATQLAMELPRTFDWLREVEQPLPKQLLVGPRVAIEDGALGMLGDDDLQVERARPPIELAGDAQPPGLAASMLLLAVCRGEAPPSLLARPRIELPVGSGRLVTIAAALVAGAAMSWSAFVDFATRRGLQYSLDSTKAEAAQLQRRIAEQRQVAATPAPSADEALVAAACATRRPMSLLLAGISNAVTPTVHLDELEFSSGERIVVSGTVIGASRREALADLAGFGKRLRELPFVQPDGQDDVAEVAGQNVSFRFKLGLAWRKP